MRPTLPSRCPAAALAALLAIFGAVTSFAQAPEAAPVTLELKADGEDCATIAPKTVEVYVAVPPHVVEWTVLNKDPGHTWVMEYDGTKPGGTGDQFGARIRIPCGSKDSARSGAASRPGVWPYRVSVYGCPGGETPPPEAEPICVVDPEVIIKDRPGG